MLTFDLPTNGPLDLAKTIACGQGHRWLDVDGHDGWYSGVIKGDLIYISQPDPVNGSLKVATDAIQSDVKAKLRWQFRLRDEDENITDVYAELEKDSKMKGLVAKYPGLRVMRVDPWECLVFFILARNAGIKPTQSRMEKIADTFKCGIRLQNDRHPFPMPEDMLAPSQDGLGKLTALGLGLDKHTKIFEAAECVKSSGRVAIALQKKLRGVADKTQNCVKLFSLDQLGAFPVDAHIRSALRGSYAEFPTSTWAPTQRKWAQNRFGRYAGYASQFLFMDDYKLKINHPSHKG